MSDAAEKTAPPSGKSSSKSSRRRAREFALQGIYQWQLSDNDEAAIEAAVDAAIAANPDDLRARHLLGAQQLMAGKSQAALEQFLEMLRRNRSYEDNLPKKSLIDAFRVIEDEDLVSQYRRKMASLLF